MTKLLAEKCRTISGILFLIVFCMLNTVACYGGEIITDGVAKTVVLLSEITAIP